MGVCGDRIIMLTQSGIHAFDGHNTSKINLNIDNLFENTNNYYCTSAYCNGKYYLACNLKFKDDKKIICENGTYGNNALLELDLQTNTLNILRGRDIRHLNAVTDDRVSKLIACYVLNNKYYMGEVKHCGTYFNKPLPKMWESPLSDFGSPEKQKVIKNIYLKSKTAVNITIKTDFMTKNYNIMPKGELVS